MAIALSIGVGQNCPGLASLLDVQALPDGQIEVTVDAGTVTVTVTAPAIYAGTYVTSTTALAAGPVNLVAPAIAGTAAVGAVLTATPGLWVYDTTQTVPATAWQWRANGTPIAGATGPNFTVTAAQAGTSVTVAEQATNSAGSIAAVSAGLAIPAAYDVAAEPTLRARFQGASGITTVSGAVSAWAASTGAVTVTQGTASARPAYASPDLTFDGTGDRLEAASRLGLGVNPALAVLVVGNVLSTPATNSSAWGLGSASGNFRGIVSSTGIGWAHGDGNHYFGTVPTAGWHIFVWRRPAASTYGQSGLQVDGTDRTETSVSNGTTSPSDASAAFQIGASVAGGNNFPGHIAIRELMVFETNDPTVINKAVGDAAWRWNSGLGLVANLPAGHPYKSAPP